MAASRTTTRMYVRVRTLSFDSTMQKLVSQPRDSIAFNPKILKSPNPEILRFAKL